MEIFTVGNKIINDGKPVKKYITFNNEDGWHIPNILLDHLKAAECQIFAKVTRNGQEFMEPKNIKAFNVEILPPLTEEERQALEIKQLIPKFLLEFLAVLFIFSSFIFLMCFKSCKLDKICPFSCEEYRDLKKAIAEVK